MGIELESETRIVIGRLAAPSDPARAWWWQSSTFRDGVEIIMGGLAPTENDAILEAAAKTIDLRAAVPPPPPPDSNNGSHADAEAELRWSTPTATREG